MVTSLGISEFCFCRLRRRGPIGELLGQATTSNKKLDVSERFGSLTSVFGRTFIDIVEEDLRGHRGLTLWTNICSDEEQGLVLAKGL
jgi:hypothetical protein